MKKIATLLIHFLLIVEVSSSQSSIVVAESTVKIEALGEKVYYYGFCEGDQVIINLEELNGKELTEFEMIEYPSTPKFQDYKTKKVINKIIFINNTGIYKFRFFNSSLGRRIVQINLQRVPAKDSLKNFNTNVYWRTIYDTSFSLVQENYLIRKDYKPISIIPESEFFVNSGSNAIFKGGKSRITFPVTLPKETQEWYYVFSASRNSTDIENSRAQINLVGQLLKLIDQTGTLSFGIEMLSAPPGGDACDVYLLDFNNKGLFEAKEPFRYISAGTRENLTSGIVKIKYGAGKTYYVGIKNPDNMYGIEVNIEVVAIVLEEKWGTRNVQKVNVSSKEEPYLIN